MSHPDNGFRLLTLQCFPVTDDINPLQVQEAADEYLLQQLDDTRIRDPMLIPNDAFGVLSCVLAGHKPYSIGDSYISELATRENLRLNEIDESSTESLDSTADYPRQPDVVLIRVPKTLALLEQQLRAPCKVVTPDTRVIAGAKARDTHASTLEPFEKVLGLTITTLAWRKARLTNCTFNESPLADTSQTVSWKPESAGWTIYNHANAFSHTGLDIGARSFMQYLSKNLEGEIVDLGCGNGVIGLTLLDKNPQVKVVLVGELLMVIASSRLDVEISMPEALDRCEFMTNSTLSGVEPFRLNTVLCNSPLHQQRALINNVA